MTPSVSRYCPGTLLRPVRSHQAAIVLRAESGLLAQAIEVLGPDRVVFGADDPYGSAGYTAAAGAREFVAAAPISAQDKAKLAYLNAERILGLRTG